MTHAAIGYLRRQYLCVLRRCAAKNIVMVLGAGMAGGAALAQAITPDGRTQTQLSVNGSVTDITTRTVQGANAFNSFTTFNVNAGNTVNLHLPGQTTNLLNLVHGERSYINGLLNAYQNGQLGGNVFFFNPHGVIVGQQGVLNVGSLTLATPSTDFMNRLISPLGVVDAAATSMALAGQVPLSATGLIRVQGRINALQAVTLAAGQVDVAAGAQVRAGGEARVAFQNLVNIAQVPMAAGVRLDGGVVRLLAAGDITVAGEVSANGSGADAHGGRVEIIADHTATLQQGALVSANAGSSGDGGFVDFSARQHVVLEGGSLQARATLGTAGSVLIDPANITIASDLLRSTAGNSGGGGISWDAGSLTLQADEQINVAANVVISTRSVAGGTRNDHINGVSTGASGNLTLKAAHIDLAEGSMLLAQGGNGHEGGDVRVLATDINALGASRTADASIRAEKAVIRGRDVTLRANADTSAIVTLLETAPGTTLADAQSYLNSELDDLSDGPGGEQLAVKTKATATTTLLGTTVQGTGAVVIEAKAGARAGFEKQATATVTVGDFVPATGPVVASDISGQTVSILAKSDTSLTYNVLGTALTLADQSWLPDPDSGLVQLVNDQLFDFSEIPLVALSDSHASVTIGGASEVHAVDKLDIKAEAIAVAKPTFASPLLFSAAWGEADTSAHVLVNGTSLLQAGGAATVKATSDVELNVSATVTSTNKPIDATFARGQTDTDTSVTVGDNTRIDTGSLEVAAKTTADITVLANSANSGGSGVGLAAAVNESTSSTVATLGGDVTTRSGDVDVTATTDVTNNSTSASASTLGNPTGIANKIANLKAGLQRGVTSALLTATGKVSASQADALSSFMFPGIKEGKFNASGAVAYTDSDNTASASIAPQASVSSAAGVDVTASITERPSASATAASTSTGNAIGGSAVVANFGNHANATIGNSAQVDALGAIRVDAQTRVPYPWQIQWSSPVDILTYLQRDLLDMVLTSYTLNSAKGKDGVGIAAGVSLLGFDNNASAAIAEGAQINQRTNSTLIAGLDLSQQSVDVFARNEVNLVTAAGIASKKFFGSTGGKGAIGGVASILDIGGTASAGIHDGASVRAEQSVKVDAESQHHLVAVTEAGGSADSVTVQGAVSLITMDTDTVAFIDDKARIQAGQNVTVEAGSDLRTIAIAGGIAATKGPVGIGMSVSLNSIDNHVSALIGNVDPVGDTAAATGTIDAGGDLTVQAVADTEIGAYSLAGAVATNSSQQTSAPASAGTTDSGSGSAAGGAGGGQGKFGIAMSGDASVNDITATTVARLGDGVNVTQANDVTVQADNTLAINALSGAVTISTQPQGNSIAGSYAQNTLAGTTTATLLDATVDMSGDLSVKAGVDGSIQTLTASLAGAKGKVGVAGSVSINEIANLTQVLLSNAHVNGAGSVTLYSADISSIRSVAGALAFGGKAGVGLSFAWNKINNDTSTLVDTSDIEASGTVSVQAASDNAIDSISASIGASKGPMAGAGAVSINTINNTTAATVNGKLADGIDAGGAVAITADDSSRIFALAGGVGATSGQAGFGAAVAWSEVNNTVAAKATNGAQLQSRAAGVQVKAVSDTEVQAIAAAGGAADKVAVAGSFSAVQTHNTTLAEVSGASVIDAAGAVLVGASDTSGIESLAGSVALSGQAALGVAVAYNVIDNDTEAKAAQSTLDGASVTVEAATDADIASAAVGGGGAAKVAVTGSLGFNEITNRTAATATGATLTASGNASVLARDSSAIGSVSGAAAVGGNGAVGAAGSYNHINGTVLAEVSGGAVTAANTTVRAQRSGELEVWAISGAGAGTAGFAGSIAINDVGGTNTARVGAGAVVQSGGNALVVAETDDVIKSRAGAVNVSGTVGGAGAVAFNDMHADTLAEVTGAGTQVTGLGNGAADAVDNGALGSASTLAARQQKDNLRGVAVVASSTSAVENYAISAAGGGSATVAATVSVALLGGSTTAELGDGAELNSSLGNAAQEARVGAFHHDSITSGTGGGAIGGDAGLGGAVDTAVVSHTTTARVQNASAQAQQAVAVQARASTEITQAAIAVGGGAYAGLAGTGALILLDGTTQALVHNADLASKGNLSVQARSDTEIDLIAGALAVSGAVGVGVTAAVTLSEQQTTARVDGTSTLNADGTTLIAADTSLDQTNHAYTAAAAGGAGVAGTVSVVVAKGSTEAALAGTASINADSGFASAAQDVRISASDSTTVANKLGSLGVGGVGVGAVVDVIMVNNGASASVGSGTRITADRDIAVVAQSTRSIDSLTTAAAGGYTAGIAGAASVITVGARPEGDARDNTSGSVDKASQMVSGSATGNQLAADNSSANASAQRADAARSGVALGSDLNAVPTNTSAGAVVASGATLDAGRDVYVKATNQTTTNAVAVGAAISGGLALGGGIAIAMVDDRTLATLAGSTTAGGHVNVQALDHQAGTSTLRTYAGGAGLAGLAASYAWHDKSSSAKAQLGGVVIAGGAVDVGATLEHDLVAEGGAAAVGAVGIGAAIAKVDQDSLASAELLDGARVTASALSVGSDAKTSGTADVVAAAGGLFAGAAGALADANDSTQSLAAIGANTFIRTGSGAFTLHADVNPQARAEALGASVSGGVSIGASLANADVNTVARASTGADADIVAGSMDVRARTLLSGDTAVANATAAAGGLLLGASATEANARVNAITEATLGNRNDITTGAELAVRALSTTSARADAMGINAGLLAGGSNTALARTNTQTRVFVGDEADLVAGTLRLHAEGNDTLRAGTVSGAGGLGVVIASLAQTDADARTSVQLGTPAGIGGTVVANSVDIDAVQHVNFDATADSTSAAAVGASGARALNDVNSQVLAAIGQNMAVAAKELFSARAGNDIDKSTAGAGGYQVDSGSGGVLNAAAARSSSTILNDAQVTVGQDALIGVDNPALRPVLDNNGRLVNVPVNGLLELAASNDVAAYDRVRLDSGGAIAIARAESVIDNVSTAGVTIAGDASLFSDGNIEVSARTAADIQTRAHSKTYGLAGAAEGNTRSTITADQSVRIGAGAFVEAQESVYLMAGADRTQTNQLDADAETRLWNRTAIPIETDPDALGRVVQHNDVTVAAGAQVRAVRDVHLTASEGAHRARGYGEGTDLYLEVLSALGEFFGADTSSLKITGGSSYDNANLTTPAGGPSSKVQVDGSVRAGIWSQQWITVAADGSITTSESLDGMATRSDGQNVAQLLQQEIDTLEAAAAAKRQQYDNFKGGSAAAAAIEAQAAATAQKTSAQQALTEANAVKTNIQAFVDTARDAGSSAAAAAAAASNAASLAADQATTGQVQVGTTAAVRLAAAASATASAASAANASAAASAAALAESAYQDLNKSGVAGVDQASADYVTAAKDASEQARAVANATSAQEAVFADGSSSAGARTAAVQATSAAVAAANAAARTAASLAAGDAETTATRAVAYANTQLTTATAQLTQANADVVAAQNAGSSSDAALGMFADAQILSTQLTQLQGATNVDFVDIGAAGDIITARSGNVRVNAKALTGGGDLVAPGDAKIEIKNQSTRFMRVNADLLIPDEGGGQVTFNGMRVSNSADINLRNAVGQSASLGITDALNTAKPSILVENSNSLDSGNSGSPAQLWIYGNVTNLGGEAKATSHGTLRVAGNISAETVSLATGGDFIKTWTPGYTHQGGDPVAQLGTLPDQSEATKSDQSEDLLTGCGAGPCGSTIAGNNVYISGERLNINGLIQAGLPERGIAITDSLLAAPNVGDATKSNTQAIAAARAAWLANSGTAARYIDLTNPTADGIADSGTVKLRYDAQNDRLELADVRMGGGHMELFGDIFSTGNGELRVMDGYGRINITNTTAYDLAVGRMDTGPGVEGMIRITDTARGLDGRYRGAGDTPLVTEITRVNGLATTRTNTGAGGAMQVVGTSSANDGRSTTFDPMANRRFNWINGQTTNWERTQTYETKTTWGSDFLGRDPNKSPDRTSSPSQTYTARASGDWLSIVSTQGADYLMDYSTALSPEVKTDLPSSSRKTDCFWGVCHSRIYTTQEKYSWTQYERYQHSLNASQSVAVKFTGFDTSQVKIDTQGQLLFSGLVRSVAGDITANAGQGMVSLNTDARLLGQAINLTSSAGAIGTAAAPVRVELVNGGSVTASGRDGVALATTRGDLLINSVTASQGDVNLTADGHIRTTAAGTAVTGQNVSLVSLNGGIHGLMDSLALQVETLGNDGVLSARAVGDIRLQEATGDMRVRQIASVTGDVHLATPGRLLDANSVEQVDEQTRGELLSLWTEMGLTGTASQVALNRNLASQRTVLQQQYENYFRMRDLKRQDDGSYTAKAYDASFSYRLTPVQAASLTSVNAGWGASELTAYEAQQTAAYHAAHTRFGAGGYVQNFQPTLSATETAALSAGSTWTEAQLANSLAAGLFRPTSDTDIRLEEANVVGRNVTLNAQSGIGLQQATPVVITLDANGLLSDAHKLALLTAERSDITVDGNGQIRVKQYEDLDVTVSGTLNAGTTSGSVLLGSEADLTIGQVSATDEVRIKTGASLLGVAGLTNVVAHSAVLEAGQGQLGSAATPFAVDLGAGGTLTARAGTDLFVREVNGDMLVNTVYARGNVTLDAQGSLLEATEDSKLDVRGDSITLSAGNTVGQRGGQNALDVQVGRTGVLSASAPNGIYLSASGLSGKLGDITTQGEFQFTVVDGGITLVGNVQADAGVLIGAADDIHFEGGRIRTDGDAVLRAGTDGTGSITRTGGTGPEVRAGGEVRLTAPDAIGTTEALRVASSGPLHLQGRLMNVNLSTLVPGAAAVVHVSGIGGSTAQDVKLDVRGAGDLQLATFVVGNAQVSTDAPTLSVPAGFVGDAVTFTTPFFNVRIDKQDRAPAPLGTTVRGFTLDGDFFLTLSPTEVVFSDYLINYDLRRLVYGTPPGSAELTVGAGLLGTRFVPSQRDGYQPRRFVRDSELIDINLNGLDRDL
ncbi:leukotoxin LktA family filamentous adhesin [Hydrogenophaga sp.]|uniref:leukotoxin LktA family filamentous adhesin n=1 Tax=Hydrogenophaga sp. TaxID=1904254 RepID=UPI002730C8EB|nr:leukotoxin LktA family filamentous adhesin [Hydrogenophaga sp.]MDP1688111.1 leukotoxin LktA family filamentous adhesin [Hydrogenophaga sp.]